MLTILEIILIILGLSSSLIDVFTDRNLRIKKFLPYIYIGVCLISIIVLLITNINNTNDKGLLFEKLGKIESKVLKTESIISNLTSMSNKLDSITDKTTNIINQREKNQKVLEEQNKLLEKSNQFIQDKILNDKPKIIVPENEIKFRAIDSTKSECEINFYNNGKRDATRFIDVIFFIFKNKNGDYFFHQPYNNSLNKYGGINIHVSEHLSTHSAFPFDFNYIKTMTSGGTIIIYCSYFDEQLKTYTKEEFRIDFSNKWDSHKKSDIVDVGCPQNEKGLNKYIEEHIK
jgi:hypothetical protein